MDVDPVLRAIWRARIYAWSAAGGPPQSSKINYNQTTIETTEECDADRLVANAADLFANRLSLHNGGRNERVWRVSVNEASFLCGVLQWLQENCVFLLSEQSQQLSQRSEKFLGGRSVIQGHLLQQLFAALNAALNLPTDTAVLGVATANNNNNVGFGSTGLGSGGVMDIAGSAQQHSLVGDASAKAVVDPATLAEVDALVALSAPAVHVKGQILVTLTAILLVLELRYEHPQVFESFVEVLLDIVSDVNGTAECHLRATACQCLRELEECIPGLLVDKLGHLLALSARETSHAVQSYVTLVSCVTSHAAVVATSIHHSAGSSTREGVLQSDTDEANSTDDSSVASTSPPTMLNQPKFTDAYLTPTSTGKANRVARSSQGDVACSGLLNTDMPLVPFNIPESVYNGRFATSSSLRAFVAAEVGDAPLAIQTSFDSDMNACLSHIVAHVPLFTRWGYITACDDVAWMYSALDRARKNTKARRHQRALGPDDASTHVFAHHFRHLYCSDILVQSKTAEMLFDIFAQDNLLSQQERRRYAASLVTGIKDTLRPVEQQLVFFALLKNLDASEPIPPVTFFDALELKRWKLIDEVYRTPPRELSLGILVQPLNRFSFGNDSTYITRVVFELAEHSLFQAFSRTAGNALAERQHVFTMVRTYMTKLVLHKPRFQFPFIALVSRLRDHASYMFPVEGGLPLSSGTLSAVVKALCSLCPETRIAETGTSTHGCGVLPHFMPLVLTAVRDVRLPCAPLFRLCSCFLRSQAAGKVSSSKQDPGVFALAQNTQLFHSHTGSWEVGEMMLKICKTAFRTQNLTRASRGVPPVGPELLKLLLVLSSLHPNLDIRDRAFVWYQLLTHVNADQVARVMCESSNDSAPQTLIGLADRSLADGLRSSSTKGIAASLTLELFPTSSFCIVEGEESTVNGNFVEVPFRLRCLCDSHASEAPGLYAIVLKFTEQPNSDEQNIDTLFFSDVEDVHVPHLRAIPRSNVDDSKNLQFPHSFEFTVRFVPRVPLPAAFSIISTFSDDAGGAVTLPLSSFVLSFPFLFLPDRKTASVVEFDEKWRRMDPNQSGADQTPYIESVRYMVSDVATLRRRIAETKVHVFTVSQESHEDDEPVRLAIRLPPRYRLLMRAEQINQHAIVRVRTNFWRVLACVDDFLSALAE